MPLLHGKQLQNTSVNLNKLTGTGSLILQTGATFQVPTANITSALDVVNKFYVDSLAAGMNPHAAVKTATNVNLALATATASPFISGVTVSTNDRVLVWQQSNNFFNGIYVYNGSTFSRATDMDGNPSQEVSVGDYTFVISGSYSGNGYVVVSSGTYSGTLEPIDGAPIVWSQFTGPASFIWGNGLVNNANTISINMAGGSGLTFSGTGLTIDSAIAGSGLSWAAGVLGVNTANGLQIVADNVEIAPSVAGTGLSFSGGVLNIRNTAVTANSYGDAATVPTVTFNAQGQAIAATAVSISITSGQVNNFTSSVSGLVKAGTGITVVSTGGGATVSLTAIGATTSLGSANTVNTFTYNNFGQVTTSATLSIAIPSGQVTNFTSSVAALITATNGQISNWTASFGNTTTINTTVASGVVTANVNANSLTASLLNTTSGGATAGYVLSVSPTGVFQWIPSGAGAGTITNVIAATGLAGGGVSGAVTVSIANTGVAAGSYGAANSINTFTVNAGGQLTTAATVSISIPSGQVSNFTASVQSLAVTTVNAGPGITVAGGNTVSLTALGSTTSLGSANTINTLTYNNYGQITTSATVSIAIPSGQVTNFTASVQALASNTTAGTGITVVQSGGSATVSLTALGATTSLGSANTVNTFTYNNFGQITTSATLSISIPSGQVSNFTSSVQALAGVGTITGVNAGMGLTGGGVSGAVTLDVRVNNAISISNDDVVLGGTLSQNTIIDGDNTFGLSFSNIPLIHINQNLQIDGNLQSPDTNTYIYVSDNLVDITSSDVATGSSNVSVTNNDAKIETQDVVGKTVVRLSTYRQGQSVTDGSTNNTMVITDETSSKGVVYANDYTANFTTHSLVTKGYVDGLSFGAVNAGPGITVAGGNTVSLTALGATTSLGSANTVNTFTYNNYGQITTSATVSISIPSGQVSNFTASVQALASNTTAGTGITVVQSGGSATVSLTALGATTSLGSAATVNTFTYNNFGQITTSATLSIAIPSGQITNFTSSVNTVASIPSGQVTNFTSSVQALITASMGTPVYTQRNMTPVATTGNGASSSLALTSTPKVNEHIMIYVNGQLQFLGNGTATNVDCYFGTVSTNAKAISALTSGDVLFWNGTYIGFDLSTTDKIDFVYNA